MDKEFLDKKTETSGCTLEEYRFVYPRLMGEFRQQYDDFDELTFIEREIKNHSIILKSCQDSMEKMLDLDYRRKRFDPIEKNYGQEIFLETISYHEKRASSHKAIINYLENKKSELEASPPSTIKIENTLNWQGSSLEFAEFTKAIIESGFIGKVKIEKEVFEKMKRFFNVEDFDKGDKLKQVRNRTKEQTPVILMLETALVNWIKRKD